MTTDELRDLLRSVGDTLTPATQTYLVARDAITELEARDRDLVSKGEECRHYAERAERAEDAAYRWWKQARENNYQAWSMARNLVAKTEKCENDKTQERKR